MRVRFDFICIVFAALLLISYPAGADGPDFTDDVTVTNEKPDLILIDDDTSGTNWYLRNDYDAGCPQCLSFMWVDGLSNQPFVIESGTDSNMVYLDSNGSVGIKTNTPNVNVDLDVWDIIPVIRLKDSDASGVSEAYFQVSNNDFTIKGNYGTPIFEMDTEAPAGSLSINSAGMVGIGTTAPAQELDIRSTSPQIRLDDTSSGQGQAELGMSNDTFSLSGNTGQRIFNVDTQAPANSLVVDSLGNLGIGTTTPASPLAIETTGANALLQLDRTDGATFKLNVATNKGQIGTQSNHKLMLTTGNAARVAIDTNGYVGISNNSPVYPLDMGTVGNGAHCTIGGVWTNGSSRASKENIKSLTAHEALDTLQGLDPVRFNYKTEKEEQYVGFIAEDVPELVATNDRKTLSTMDIVGVLTKVVQEQQKLNEEQQKIIVELSNEVRKMKKELRLRGSVALADLE